MNEKSLGAKIMRFHKLLLEMSEDKEEYKRQFENEKKFQQMMTSEGRQAESKTTHTPKSGMNGNNEFNFRSNLPQKEEDFTSEAESLEGNYRTISQIEREKEYDRLFSHLEMNEDEEELQKVE